MIKGMKMIPDIKNILCATDLSENAHYALKYATVIANRLGAAITVLHVLEELSPSSLGWVSEMVGKKRWGDIKSRNEGKVTTSIRKRIEEVCSEINDSSPECPFIVQEIIVKTGHPADLIIHHAEKKDCDMVIIGSHGHRTVAEATLGSTSRRVLRRCAKPILVVHPPESAQK
jgi:nucleotide-binding universal stress UspA family protein